MNAVLGARKNTDYISALRPCQPVSCTLHEYPAVASFFLGYKITGFGASFQVILQDHDHFLFGNIVDCGSDALQYLQSMAHSARA